mmetsp:Transcript_95343/g.253284  ORF Transcript_95343/g.253284 Transcript_95343/m.253284 type:complete len:284 (-) Transcript_95343:708-1559(-)
MHGTSSEAPRLQVRARAPPRRRAPPSRPPAQGSARPRNEADLNVSVGALDEARALAQRAALPPLDAEVPHDLRQDEGAHEVGEVLAHAGAGTMAKGDGVQRLALHQAAPRRQPALRSEGVKVLAQGRPVLGGVAAHLPEEEPNGSLWRQRAAFDNNGLLGLQVQRRRYVVHAQGLEPERPREQELVQAPRPGQARRKPRHLGGHRLLQLRLPGELVGGEGEAVARGVGARQEEHKHVSQELVVRQLLPLHAHQLPEERRVRGGGGVRQELAEPLFEVRVGLLS